MDDQFVFDRKILEIRQSGIYPMLVFACASNRDIVIAIPPVSGKIHHEPVDPLREEQEMTIRPLTYHFPGFRPPFVGSLEKKIGCEACPEKSSAGMLVIAVPHSHHRDLELMGLEDLGSIAVILRIPPVHVAVRASFADLVAPVPQVPHYSQATLQADLVRIFGLNAMKITTTGSYPGEYQNRKEKCSHRSQKVETHVHGLAKAGFLGGAGRRKRGTGSSMISADDSSFPS